MIELVVTEHDDPEFVQVVTMMLNGAVRCHRPSEVHVVHVDNWFDFRWRNFSGVVALQVGWWCGPLLRVPPFNPNRILSEAHLHEGSVSTGEFVPFSPQPLHVRQPSDRNLGRRLAQMTGRAVLLWYSATANRDRASVMTYYTGDEDDSWYASFVKKEEWRVNKVRGISKRALFELSGSQSIAPRQGAQQNGIKPAFSI